jgi:hypothetical protein
VTGSEKDSSSGKPPPVYIASVSPDTVFASRNCITSHLTGILLYTRFTFKVPEHQSYIYYYIYLRVCTVSPRSNTVLYCASVNYPRSTAASCDCTNPFPTGILLYTRFTFEAPEHQSYIYIIYICACTVSPGSNTVLLYKSAIQDSRSSRVSIQIQFSRLVIAYLPF